MDQPWRKFWMSSEFNCIISAVNHSSEHILRSRSKVKCLDVSVECCKYVKTDVPQYNAGPLEVPVGRLGHWHDGTGSSAPGERGTAPTTRCTWAPGATAARCVQSFLGERRIPGIGHIHKDYRPRSHLALTRNGWLDHKWTAENVAVYISTCLQWPLLTPHWISYISAYLEQRHERLKNR